MRYLVKVGIFAMFIFLSVNTFAQTKMITPDVIASITNVRQVSVSPDGKNVAFIVSTPRKHGDKVGGNYSELYTIASKGGEAKKLIGAPDAVSSIHWSSDSKSILFAAKRDDHKKRQVYSINPTDSKIQLVTNTEMGISSYALSPDGSTIAFTARDGATEKDKANKASGKDWIVIGKNQKFTRLYTFNIKSKEVKKVIDGNLNVTGITWAPDNATIVFTATNNTEIDHTYLFQTIYKVPASGGKPTSLYNKEGKLGSMAVSPDGKTLTFNGAVDLSDPLPQSIFVMPMAGGEAKNLTPGLKASVASVRWNNDAVLALIVEGTRSYLASYNITDGKSTELYSGNVVIRSYDVAGDMLAVAGNTPAHPTEVLTGSLKKGKLTKQTNFNTNLKDYKLGKQEVLAWTAKDGMKIEGILTYPVDYKEGSKYPLLLQIHGGPEGVSMHGWNTRTVYPVQLYAANGYFVLEPNYRGSQGKGVAFGKADHNDLGGKEFDDVLAGIDKLIADGKVDGDKVGSGGFSYGGYFSAWAATKHSDRFKAAMMGAGIFNWISFQGTTDIILENARVHWNLLWPDDINLVMDRSPVSHINNAKTPTLIVHGENDVRVPPSQGYEMYNALKLKGVPTELVIYKRQPHGIRELEAQIDYMWRTLDWFNRYVKGIEQ